MSTIDHDCLRALRTNACERSLPLSAVVVDSRGWASALFSGRRLTIAIDGDDDARLDAWLIMLPDAELTWRGHFVASGVVI